MDTAASSGRGALANEKCGRRCSGGPLARPRQATRNAFVESQGLALYWEWQLIKIRGPLGVGEVDEGIE